MLLCQEKQSMKRKYELLFSYAHRGLQISLKLSYIGHTTCKFSEGHTKGFPLLYLHEHFQKRDIFCCAEGETETGVKNSLLR